ncbi:dehydrogenase [Halorientalis sp. IM1011]|uniref:TorD/DmsD family molecular chaperone n=1 Tax=Halorientalis sp. IM1011 TaxID=1932360 RepID=UPI00097CD656|nr:molecular chaperone TorD family protein [Halorientalis sp. IM1011]AQL42410.1 dehydrogenase [Halorientalis sp. IM1011]
MGGHTQGRDERPDDTAPPTPAADGSVARARASVYGLLAAAFDGEAETLATALEDGTFARLGAELPAEIPTDALTRADLDAEALRVGYDNLFVVPGPHYVPPFASAHADDPSESFESDSPYHDEGAAGELLGDPAATMARLYAQVGFEPDRGDGIPDHVAAELEFMSALCSREATLRERDGDGSEIETLRDLQRTVVTELGWLDAFDDAVAEEDTVEGTFAALTRLARTFVAWDARDGIPCDGD